MDVRFNAFTSFPAARTAAPDGARGAANATGEGASPAGFAGALKDALQGVSRLQDEAVSLQKQFQLGAGNVSLEQTMVAMQNSNVAFQAALTVRNRLVAAYTDIMNMPV